MTRSKSHAHPLFAGLACDMRLIETMGTSAGTGFVRHLCVDRFVILSCRLRD